ncbi:MAG: hypothetical protein NTY91_01795 [Euryarchaeota archaeon]|nr:hypothetical protein [Euryarchaeota archaeon]
MSSSACTYACASGGAAGRAPKHTTVPQISFEPKSGKRLDND